MRDDFHDEDCDHSGEWKALGMSMATGLTRWMCLSCGAKCWSGFPPDGHDEWDRRVKNPDVQPTVRG